MCFIHVRLCKCVVDLNCQNFYIPENNMLYSKIRWPCSRINIMWTLWILWYESELSSSQSDSRFFLKSALCRHSYVTPFLKEHFCISFCNGQVCHNWIMWTKLGFDVDGNMLIVIGVDWKHIAQPTFTVSVASITIYYSEVSCSGGL